MTVTTTITESGLDAVLRQLAEIRLDALQPEIDNVMDWIAGDAANYPPERGYVRSGRLGRGWTDDPPQMHVSGDTLVASLENDTPYGLEVMGPGTQHPIHVDYWRTTDDILDAWENRVAEAIDDALGRLVL